MIHSMVILTHWCFPSFLLVLDTVKTLRSEKYGKHQWVNGSSVSFQGDFNGSFHGSFHGALPGDHGILYDGYYRPLGGYHYGCDEFVRGFYSALPGGNYCGPLAGYYGLLRGMFFICFFGAHSNIL